MRTWIMKDILVAKMGSPLQWGWLDEGYEDGLAVIGFHHSVNFDKGRKAGDAWTNIWPLYMASDFIEDLGLGSMRNGCP